MAPPRAPARSTVFAFLLSGPLALLALAGCSDNGHGTFHPPVLQPLAPGAPGVWQDLGLTSGFVEVEALTTWNGNLIAGGTFFGVQGNPSTSLASWDGASWTLLGPNFGGSVHAMTIWNGHLVVGGGFPHVNGDTLRYVAEWDGGKWIPLGSGLNRSVTALAVYNGDLVAGGEFDSAGGVPVNFIARWDGTSWHPVGEGFNSIPWALCVYEGELVAGGSFDHADGALAPGIASWNGFAWTSLGTGMGGGAGGNPYGTVYALGVHGDSLIAGGGFTLAGGVPANHVAKWFGSQWDSLGNGVGDFSYEYVRAVGEYADTLVVGGTFPGSVMRWTGSAWMPMSSLDGFVNAFAEHDGYLVAGGYFPKGPGQPANGIARWGK